MGEKGFSGLLEVAPGRSNAVDFVNEDTVEHGENSGNGYKVQQTSNYAAERLEKKIPREADTFRGTMLKVRPNQIASNKIRP